MASITEIVISKEERRGETAPLSLEEVELRPPPEAVSYTHLTLPTTPYV